MKRDHFSPDIQEFFRLLAEHQVRYLLIGGEAVIYHGYPRLTGDVGLHFQPSPENVRRLFKALLEFWSGDVPGIANAEELLEPELIIQFGRPPNRIDLISSLEKDK